MIDYGGAGGNGVMIYGFSVQPRADAGTLTVFCSSCAVPVEIHPILPIPIEGGGTWFDLDLTVVDAVADYDPATTTTWSGIWDASGTFRFDARLGQELGCMTWGDQASLLGTDCQRCVQTSNVVTTTGGSTSWDEVDDCSP